MNPLLKAKGGVGPDPKAANPWLKGKGPEAKGANASPQGKSSGVGLEAKGANPQGKGASGVAGKGSNPLSTGGDPLGQGTGNVGYVPNASSKGDPQSFLGKNSVGKGPDGNNAGSRVGKNQSGEQLKGTATGKEKGVGSQKGGVISKGPPGGAEASLEAEAKLWEDKAARAIREREAAEQRLKDREGDDAQQEATRLKREKQEEERRKKLAEDEELLEQRKKERARMEKENAAERQRLQKAREEEERRGKSGKAGKGKPQQAPSDYHPVYRPRFESDSDAESPIRDTAGWGGGGADSIGAGSNFPLSDDLLFAPQRLPMESPVQVEIWPPEEMSPKANAPILGRAAAFTWARRLEGENQQLKDHLATKEENLISGPGDDKAEDWAGADARRRGLALLLQLGSSSVEEKPSHSSHAAVDNSAVGLARRFLQSRYPAGIGVALAEDGPEPGQDGIVHMRKENRSLFTSAAQRFSSEIREKRMSVRALQAQNEVMQKRRVDADHRLEVMTEAAKGERMQRERLVNEELRLCIDEIKRLDFEAEDLYRQLDRVNKRPQTFRALGNVLKDAAPKNILLDAFVRWNRLRPSVGK